MKKLSYAFLVGTLSVTALASDAFCGKDHSQSAPEDIYKYYETKRQAYRKQGNEDKALSNFKKANRYFPAYLNHLKYENAGLFQKTAFTLYQEATNHEHSTAQCNLGEMYYFAQGVEQDYKNAFECFQKAAAQGCAKAQYNLGFMYENGQGIDQDYQQAVYWYQKAADQGCAGGFNGLGMLYAKGYGVDQSWEKAVELYQQAADKGNDAAFFNLGFSYAFGLGVKQNVKKGLECHRRATKTINVPKDVLNPNRRYGSI